MNKQEELFEIYKELSYELERAPKLQEFFIVVGQCVKNFSFADDLIGFQINSKEVININNDTEIYKDLYELNDNVYALITGFITFLQSEINESSHGKQEAQLIVNEILNLIKNTNGFRFSNISKDEIRKIKILFPKNRTKKKEAKVGDVIAIPISDKGEFGLVVFIAKNKFGIAYGIIDKIYNELPQMIELPIQTIKYPRYSDDYLIKKGKWPILFNKSELLSFFSASPELFHSPKYNPENEPYGVAQTPDDKLRHLSKEEADEIGIFSGNFGVFYTPSQFEFFVLNKLKK